MTAGKAVVVRDIETFSWLDHDEDCLKSIPPPRTTRPRRSPTRYVA